MRFSFFNIELPRVEEIQNIAAIGFSFAFKWVIEHPQITQLLLFSVMPSMVEAYLAGKGGRRYLPHESRKFQAYSPLLTSRFASADISRSLSEVDSEFSQGAFRSISCNTL